MISDKEGAGKLMSPSQRRKELNELKSGIQQYNEFKTQQQFYGKRQRTIACGWRHGITAV
jgi:hypothetical protein